MKFKLRNLFWQLLKLANQYRDPIYGDPCTGLLEQMCLYQDSFLACFENAKDTCCDSHEYRLNEAGLKLNWMKYKGRIWMDICGDQKGLYPQFVLAAEETLRMYGFKSINSQE